MLKQMKTVVLAIIVVWAGVGTGMTGGPVLAQNANQAEQAVTRTVTDLVRAEAEGNINRLYDLMAPESRDIIPRQALANWYGTSGRMIPVEAPEITSITFDDWESEISGDVYEDVAFVEYSVAVESGRQSDVRDAEMLLWNDGQYWRWFFEGMDDDIDDVAEMSDWTVTYESPYRTEMFRNIDTFWAQMFANAGLEYRPPVDMVGVVVEPTRTGCGTEDDIAMAAVYYCTLDETIYYDPDFRDMLVDNIGEYAWDHVISHEWGHHIQRLLDINTSRDPELQGGQYTIEHELQADCLSGIFGQDALARGIIRSRDMNHAMSVISVAGDARGTAWDDVTAHGTSAQREQSFWTGYDSGLIGCHISLGVTG